MTAEEVTLDEALKESAGHGPFDKDIRSEQVVYGWGLRKQFGNITYRITKSAAGGCNFGLGSFPEVDLISLNRLGRCVPSGSQDFVDYYEIRYKAFP